MTIDSSRVMSSALRSRVMSADDAAALVPHGANVGMSGFTGSGYPKAVPMALARRIEQAQARGEQFRIGVWTGASTAPELDGALAKVNGIELRLPYQSDPVTRERINETGIVRIRMILFR
jgi:succinyl-CoA:acetate CoA-transferase